MRVASGLGPRGTPVETRIDPRRPAIEPGRHSVAAPVHSPLDAIAAPIEPPLDAVAAAVDPVLDAIHPALQAGLRVRRGGARGSETHGNRCGE
jgi:hypothetical protein